MKRCKSVGIILYHYQSYVHQLSTSVTDISYVHQLRTSVTYISYVHQLRTSVTDISYVHQLRTSVENVFFSIIMVNSNSSFPQFTLSNRKCPSVFLSLSI